MVVRIRLRRTGRRNRACFRLCAIEGRRPRDGRMLENLGFYDPLAPRVEDQLKLDTERVVHWVSKGAQLSETAQSLCRRQGIAFPAAGPAPRKRKPKMSETRVRAKTARKAALHKAKTERRAARVDAKKAKAAEAAEAS